MKRTLILSLLLTVDCGGSEHVRAPDQLSDSAREESSSDAGSSVAEPGTAGDEHPPEYPKNLYDTPAGPARTLAGRWGIDFEGSVFQESSTGKLYSTSLVDHALRKYVKFGTNYYDWAGCLDVEIVASLAELPSPDIAQGAWLIIREVRAARLVPGLQEYGAPCLDIERARVP
jgi:hypothetical protein